MLQSKILFSIVVLSYLPIFCGDNSLSNPNQSIDVRVELIKKWFGKVPPKEAIEPVIMDCKQFTENNFANQKFDFYKISCALAQCLQQKLPEMQITHISPFHKSIYLSNSDEKIRQYKMWDQNQYYTRVYQYRERPYTYQYFYVDYHYPSQNWQGYEHQHNKDI
jgi:hypothetical protein